MPVGYPPTLALLPASLGYERGDYNVADQPDASGMDERGFLRQNNGVKFINIGAEDPDAPN